MAKYLNKQQSGQAVLEYVLLLFVIVSIVAGIILGISQSTQRFVENYFGSYLQCLLETGELPRLNADDLPETECDDIFEPFTLSGGRPLSDAGASTNGAETNLRDNTSDPTDSANSGSDDDSEGGAGDANVADGGSGAGSSGADGPISSAFANTNGRSSRVPTTSTDKVNSSDGSKTDTLKGTNNFGTMDEDSFGDGRTQYVPIYSGLENEIEQEKGRSELVAATAAESIAADSKARNIPNIKRDPQTLQKDTDAGLTFSDYLKYLVIAIIVLVIIIVIGGQILQFQKGME